MKNTRNDPAADLFAIRYPDGDDSVTDALRIAAIADRCGAVSSLVQAMEYEGIIIDTLCPDDDVVSYFALYSADALIISSDSLSEDYIYELTRELLTNLNYMPLLINVRQIEKRWLYETYRNYNGRYFIDMPFDPPAEARKLCNFLMRSVLTEEYYSMKIKSTVIRTLISLGCDMLDDGFQYIADAAFIVLNYPYLRLNYNKDVYPVIAEEYGKSVKDVKTAVRAAADSSFGSLGKRERELLLAVYPSGTEKRSGLDAREYIGAIAYLASKPCSSILRCLQEEPCIKSRPELSAETLINKLKEAQEEIPDEPLSEYVPDEDGASDEETDGLLGETELDR